MALRTIVVGGAARVTPATRPVGRPRRRRPIAAHRVLASSSLDVKLIPSDGGSELDLSADVTSVGSAPGSGLLVAAEGVAAEHAVIEKKSGRLFCKALLGDGDMMADTRTWLNGNQLRSGVDYMVPAGAELAFGQEAPTWTAQFTEAEVNDAMAKLMMNAMAQGASDDVKKQLDNM
mmetsp:Transcript_19221/g.49337  ORF Transcript_19221/g.49337 Transcript_19221/m.49337 type:complete len:176 (+) Transcript_19221:245-772(+)|eukprot:jgi/Tetstr1/433871/TSEL_023051.t1